VFQLRSAPVLSHVAAILFRSIVLLTSNGNFLGSAFIAFSERYVLTFIYVRTVLIHVLCICTLCVHKRKKGPLTGPHNQNFNYIWRSREHPAYRLHTFLRSSERAYVSQWCASRTKPSVVRTAAEDARHLPQHVQDSRGISGLCRRKGSQQWTALQHS